MPNNAIHSKGTKLEIKVGSTFTKVNGFKGFDGLGGGSPAVIDTTDLDSAAKEKLMGLKDEGSMSFTFNYLETDVGQLAMEAARNTGNQTTIRITLKNAITYTVDGFVMTWAQSAGVDAVVAVSSTFEITGALTKGTVV